MILTTTLVSQRSASDFFLAIRRLRNLGAELKFQGGEHHIVTAVVTCEGGRPNIHAALGLIRGVSRSLLGPARVTVCSDDGDVEKEFFTGPHASAMAREYFINRAAHYLRLAGHFNPSQSLIAAANQAMRQAQRAV